VLKPYALKFRPIFKERIWGGNRLKSLLNKEIISDNPVGESWELADLPDDCSVVADGLLAGVSMREVLEHHGGDFGFSPEHCRPPFGLLIKFLDAREVLSVQVHPDEQACRLFPNANPKSECWYVIDAMTGACIYRGLKPGVDEKQLRQAIRDGRVEELLERYPACAGDFHFLPGGTVHALGAGIVVAEIQTPSDTTFRLYDWNRFDGSGRSRELHIKQALASIHYPDKESVGDTEDPMVPKSTWLSAMWENAGDGVSLTKCRYFNVARATISAGQAKTPRPPLPFVMIILKGSGCIATDCSPDCRTPYRTGDTILVPAAGEIAMTIEHNTRCLLVSLGDD
jgi:mannose-6-phosphate isomerase